MEDKWRPKTWYAGYRELIHEMTKGTGVIIRL
jgi:hypothetical protein